MPTKYSPEYYLAHKERHQETMKSYYTEKREKIITKQLAYHHANKESINALRRERRAARKISIE